MKYDESASARATKFVITNHTRTNARTLCSQQMSLGKLTENHRNPRRRLETSLLSVQPFFISSTNLILLFWWSSLEYKHPATRSCVSHVLILKQVEKLRKLWIEFLLFLACVSSQPAAAASEQHQVKSLKEKTVTRHVVTWREKTHSSRKKTFNLIFMNHVRIADWFPWAIFVRCHRLILDCLLSDKINGARNRTHFTGLSGSLLLSCLSRLQCRLFQVFSLNFTCFCRASQGK